MVQDKDESKKDHQLDNSLSLEMESKALSAKMKIQGWAIPILTWKMMFQLSGRNPLNFPKILWSFEPLLFMNIAEVIMLKLHTIYKRKTME